MARRKVSKTTAKKPQKTTSPSRSPSAQYNKKFQPESEPPKPSKDYPTTSSSRHRSKPSKIYTKIRNQEDLNEEENMTNETNIPKRSVKKNTKRSSSTSKNENKNTEKKVKPDNPEFDNLKNQGNALYKKCCETYPGSLWSEHLLKAIGFYQEAMTKAQCDQEMASAHKNIGMSYLKLFQVANLEKEQINYAMEALNNFTKAKEYGKYNAKDWLSHLNNEIEGIIDNAIDICQIEDRLARINHYYRLLNAIKVPPEAVMKINFKLANVQFFEAVTSCEQKNYLKTLKLLADMNQPLLEAIKIAKSLKKTEALEELADLQDRGKIHLSIAESMKAKEHAKATIDKMIKEEDGMQMDMIWDAIDQLHFAKGLLKNQDLETEAEIYSELGEIYFAFLKSEEEGIEHFRESIRLANALIPRIMTSVPWFKKATQRVHNHQEKLRRQEEDQAQQEHNKILAKYGKELETTLEEIKKTSEKETVDFVKFLYQKHPSRKTTSAKFDENLDVKKMLQVALVIYHPDKNQNQDEKWIFITTEITKYLNYHYSQYTC